MIEVRRHLEAGDRRIELEADARRGLESKPRSLPPKYFYDERGSRLFEAITKLPEYYLTRTEAEILRRVTSDVVGAVRPTALIEFGSGNAEKTRILLDAMQSVGLLRGYAPIDVSESSLCGSAEEIAREYPGVRVVAVLADFKRPLSLPFEGERRLVAFLGSTIGNLTEGEAAEFLVRLCSGLRGGDAFLIGFDLVKEPERLVAAYDDAAGVTASFNRNVLRVLNRELEADFDPEEFHHEARYDPEAERIEMRLVARRPQTVRLGRLGRVIEFEEGEWIRTELSHKYTRASATALLEGAGFRMERWMTDPDELFAVALAVPARKGASVRSRAPTDG